MARQKKSKNSALAVNAITFSSMYIGGLLLLPFIGGVEINDFKVNWWLYLLSALAFNAAFILMYKAAAHLESAIVTVINTSTALYTLIIAGLLYGERLTTVQLIGSAILLPCIWYVAMLAKKQNKMFRLKNIRKGSWLTGVGLVLAGSFMLSIGHIIEKRIFETSSIGSLVAFGILIEVFLAWLLFVVFGKKQRQVFKSNFLISGSIKLGIIRLLTATTFFYALIKSDNLTLITVIANFRIVIVAVLAGWLLNERRFYYRKLIAAAISVVALSIIFWN